jgi:hypothetical protein
MSKVAELFDLQLNREIAKALGYTVYQYNEVGDKPGYYVLLSPEDTRVVIGTKGHRSSEDTAWRDAPDWTCDLEVALDLVWEFDYRLEHHANSSPAYACELMYLKDRLVDIELFHYSFPMAICATWLTWKRLQNDH